MFQVKKRESDKSFKTTQNSPSIYTTYFPKSVEVEGDRKRKSPSCCFDFVRTVGVRTGAGANADTGAGDTGDGIPVDDASDAVRRIRLRGTITLALGGDSPIPPIGESARGLRERGLWMLTLLLPLALRSRALVLPRPRPIALIALWWRECARAIRETAGFSAGFSAGRMSRASSRTSTAPSFWLSPLTMSYRLYRSTSIARLGCVSHTARSTRRRFRRTTALLALSRSIIRRSSWERAIATVTCDDSRNSLRNGSRRFSKEFDLDCTKQLSRASMPSGLSSWSSTLAVSSCSLFDREVSNSNRELNTNKEAYQAKTASRALTWKYGSERRPM